jgi:protein-S-isoprenylcysteine O-methyltransferase Ste14
LLVFLATAGWGVLHSWLASFAAKAVARRIFGERVDRYYRLFFVLFAAASLLPILAMVVFLPSRVLWVIPSPWIYLTLVVQFLALVALVATALQTDVMAFAGLRQILQPDTAASDRLVISGFYRLVRHPLYLFSLILFWLFPRMTDLTLAFFLAATLYFMLGSIPEERKLLATFGEQYRQYRREVPWLIPGLKFRRKR